MKDEYVGRLYDCMKKRKECKKYLGNKSGRRVECYDGRVTWAM